MADSMLSSSAPGSLPSLPQKDDEKRSKHRAYELSLARTRYNYTTSYLYPAPLAAQVPDSEKFTLAYKAKVAPVLLEVAENLKSVLVARFEAQLNADLPADADAVDGRAEGRDRRREEAVLGPQPAEHPRATSRPSHAIFEALHDAPAGPRRDVQEAGRDPAARGRAREGA